MIRLVFNRGVAAVLIAVAISFSAVPARAGGQAEQFVQQVALEVVKAANTGSTAQFRSIMRKHADIPAISKMAVGRHGRGLSDAERKKVQQVVEQMIAKGFAKHASWLRGDGIEVTGSTQGARTVQVSTRIVGGSVDELKWKLVKHGSRFRVIDICVGGLWLSSQMRSKLSSKLKGARGDVLTALAN